MKLAFVLLCATIIAASAAFIEDFESFNAGDVVNKIVPGNDITIDVSAGGCSKQAMIFDSENPSGGDNDLSTENKGKILIISEDGDASDPDDCKHGGVLRFKFSPNVFISSIGLLDIEEGAIVKVSPPGEDKYEINVPSTPNNSYVSVPINDGANKIAVKLLGSGGVTEIEYDYDFDQECDHCPCFDSEDLLSVGDIYLCGDNFPDYDGLAGIIFSPEGAGAACSGFDCIAGTIGLSCAIIDPLNLSFQTDLTEEQDGCCQSLIMNICPNPNRRDLVRRTEAEHETFIEKYGHA